jgi:putative flippase GtrA
VQRENFVGFVIRLLKFGFVGGTVTIVNLGILALTSHFLDPYTAFLVAYVPSVILHFTLNKQWVFRCGRQDLMRQILQYSAVAAMNFAINFALYALAFHFITRSTLIANLIAIPPTTLLGYLLFQKHVFHSARTTIAFPEEETGLKLGES